MTQSLKLSTKKIEASDTFNRLYHRKLFDILDETKKSRTIILIRQVWYCNKKNRLRWDSSLSVLLDFKRTCPTRQDCILKILNLCMDHLWIIDSLQIR